MQVVMVMFRADGERRSFSLTRDLTVIGRREDCDLRIPLGDVSRKHCRVVRNADYITLEDLGSSNGTFINGQRIQEATLNAGDTVQVGPVVFCVQIDGVPAEEEMTPIFAAPAEPYNEGVEPVDETAELMEDSAVAVEDGAIAEPEAELDDFEAVDADDVEPARPAVPPPLPPQQGGEEEAELTADIDVFTEDDETAAQADQIAASLEEDHLEVVDPSAETTDEEVSLDEFEIVDGDEAAPESDESGETPTNQNRH